MCCGEKVAKSHHVTKSCVIFTQFLRNAVYADRKYVRSFVRSFFPRCTIMYREQKARPTFFAHICTLARYVLQPNPQRRSPSFSKAKVSRRLVIAVKRLHLTSAAQPPTLPIAEMSRGVGPSYPIIVAPVLAEAVDYAHRQAVERGVSLVWLVRPFVCLETYDYLPRTNGWTWKR